MLEVRIGPDQSTRTESGRRPSPGKRIPTEVPLPVVLLVFSVLLIVVAVAGLLLIHQLPAAFVEKTAPLLANKSLPPETTQVMSLITDQIQKLVATLRPYFVAAIVVCLLLWSLHRWAYWAALAFFALAIPYFLICASQVTPVALSPAAGDLSALGRILQSVYNGATLANMLILAVLAACYRSYMRAWEARWSR